QVACQVAVRGVHADLQVPGVPGDVHDQERHDPQDAPDVRFVRERTKTRAQPAVGLRHATTSAFWSWPAIVATIVSAVTSAPFSISAIFSRSLSTRMRSLNRTTSS